jgi:YidC/Oxa1 family membrane protein insertase
MAAAMDDQNKNLILATALSLLVIVAWTVLFPSPPITPDAAVNDTTTATTTATDPSAPDLTTPGVTTAPDGTAVAATTDASAPEAGRITIDTPRLTGSISLQGGRIDDLSLVTYREKLDPTSPMVRLLAPVGSDTAYYALYGWTPAGGLGADAVPGPNTIWTAPADAVLTTQTPVTLSWDNGAGLIFQSTISVDDRYLFTIDQSVTNQNGADVALAAYGLVARHGIPSNRAIYLAHEGLVRMTDGTLEETTYKNLPDMTPDAVTGGVSETMEVTENGWIGLADKYWMTTLIPTPGTPFRSRARYNPRAEIYQTETVTPVQTVAPGQSATVKSQLFAGAKEWETIRDYQTEYGIQKLIEAIDWGWFFFFTKPIFALLHWLNTQIGNMGWSIMALTLILKALVLPLAYKSYVSMARMKELQPEMEKLKERAGDDKQALQKGMMALYRDNKVNPASGCLPILIQIPIFFSLYKVIFNTIELRHAAWIGWIRDLSAPDPSSILNLFGLFPWATPEPNSLFFIVSLGVLPILLGISMWLQQKLNPAPTDPTQKMVFAYMPWIFMFMLGSFASGLVLYWITNNTITFIQQYAIMRSHGHKPDLFGNISSGFRRKAEATAESAKRPAKAATAKTGSTKPAATKSTPANKTSKPVKK